MSDNKMKVFEDKEIRKEWNEEEQDWYVSIVDVIEVLTGTDNPRRYWSDLKRKLRAEGSQLYEEIVQLKMIAPYDKNRLTDVAKAAREQYEKQSGKNVVTSQLEPALLSVKKFTLFLPSFFAK